MISTERLKFQDELAKKVHELYDSLGKSGKPKADEEWTCLAAFILEVDGKCRVVSLSTGTKCIGGNSMTTDGSVVNDSHAEVLARRNFLRFLYNQLKLTQENDVDTIFSCHDSKFCLKNGVNFHFYASQVPCGDASIIPMDCNNSCQESLKHKRKLAEESGIPDKKIKLDVHRTGAKPVMNETRKDPKKDGMEYHVRGAVRIKPGRGDPTKSLSCSDKIAKWLYCGLQGALLSLFLEVPLELSTIIIGGAGPYDANVMKEALVCRSGLQKTPEFLRSNVVFGSNVFGPLRPCASSIHWADITGKKLEVSADGRKLGVTKQSKSTAFLQISKRCLFKAFIELAGSRFEGMSYREVKDLSISYRSRQRSFLTAMGSWSEDKTLYENFVLK